MEQIEALNRFFFLKINAVPGTATWKIDSAILIANYLIYIIPILLVVLWLWGDERKRNLALKACLVAMLGVGINQIIGLAWQHPRPFMIGLGQTWLPHAPDSSFPSDHVTVLAGACISLLLARKRRLTTITFVVGLFVAWSRIFLGVHFPMDMLGALGVAAFSYAVTAPVWQKTGDAITQFFQRIYRTVMALPIARGWVRL